MEEIKDKENEFFNKASMSVVELNNYVSSSYWTTLTRLFSVSFLSLARTSLTQCQHTGGSCASVTPHKACINQQAGEPEIWTLDLCGLMATWEYALWSSGLIHGATEAG